MEVAVMVTQSLRWGSGSRKGANKKQELTVLSGLSRSGLPLDRQNKKRANKKHNPRLCQNISSLAVHVTYTTFVAEDGATERERERERLDRSTAREVCTRTARCRSRSCGVSVLCTYFLCASTKQDYAGPSSPSCAAPPPPLLPPPQCTCTLGRCCRLIHVHIRSGIYLGRPAGGI